MDEQQKAIRRNHPILDEHKKEIITYQNQMLHYGLYMPHKDDIFYGDIAWHWHEEFEFGYLLGGQIRYKTNQQEYLLKQGDGIFINSGVLHALHPVGPLEQVKLQSQFIDKSFLAGASGSLIDINYVAPVQEQKNLDAFPLYADDPVSRKLLEKLCTAAKTGEQREDFFELRLRSTFSEIWEDIYQRAKNCHPPKKGSDPREDARIKDMMRYIQKHYPEKLTIRQIAAHIPISERECYRLFQNTLGMTPAAYVTSHRLLKAQELLRYSEKTILEIALETGFTTSSYFGKIFREACHMSPGQYRRFSGYLPIHSAGISNL